MPDIWDIITENEDFGPELGITPEFYDSRPLLSAIRTAAHARQRSADAVLANVLGRWATIIHPRFQIPPIVGSPATFDWFGIVAGHSGTAKSSSSAIARELVPLEDRTDLMADWPLGSGEGFIDAMLAYPLNDKGKPDKTRHKIVDKQGGLFTIDEGLGFLKLVKRDGATLGSALCSAWSGAQLGQTNADLERRRFIPARRCRFVFLGSIQYPGAGLLLEDADLIGQGLPQRVAWFAAADPTIPEENPDFPDQFELPAQPALVNGREPTFIGVVPEIVTEIKRLDLLVARGSLAVPPLDAHRVLLKLKLAGLLATLEERVHMELEDWKLAEMVLDASDRLRDVIMEHASEARKEAKEAAMRDREAQWDRKASHDAKVAMGPLLGALKRIPELLEEYGPMTANQIKRKLSRAQREALDEALDELEEAEVIEYVSATESDQERYGKGGSFRLR